MIFFPLFFFHSLSFPYILSPPLFFHPLKTITCSSKTPKPFITPEILKQKSIRSRLESIYRRCKSDLNKLNFRRQSNFVSKHYSFSSFLLPQLNHKHF